ncbi:hypothetical protein OIDMADRAFT_138871 [Oidiodendron maius Zn]|uniref:Methyltransferase n=1 Tax=Oidiodendron maius (strain Zn) TaxID=913774 RepID=A0A0C3GMT1_OIDMZ|nr:hypothetical protein OIDMADRAFT_138871 [Oidiodendron maius Zn]
MATLLTPLNNTIAKSPPDISSSVEEERHDILAELNYWKDVGNTSVLVDFNTPGAQERYNDLLKLDQAHSVMVHDVRGEESKYTIDRHGFQYVQHEVKDMGNLSNDEEVIAVLLTATEQLINTTHSTGACKIVTFAHLIRCFAADERQLAASQAPAHAVHSDFTPSGAIKHLQDTIKDETELNRLLGGRVLIINVWRPLKKIFKDPLAVCDWTSVDPETDLVTYRMVFSQGWKELAKANFNPRHMWYYLGGQRPNEPLLFKQFDSKAKHGMNLLHTAFVDPQAVNYNPRESIEIKMFAFLPN